MEPTRRNLVTGRRTKVRDDGIRELDLPLALLAVEVTKRVERMLVRETALQLKASLLELGVDFTALGTIWDSELQNEKGIAPHFFPQTYPVPYLVCAHRRQLAL